MKIDQLRALDAVVQTGSFARAAQDILGISQPAVSAAIAKLETTLGFQIFNREGYRPELTQAGAAYYKQARQLLDKTNLLEAYAQTLALGQEPEIRIAFDANHLLPQFVNILKTQTQAHPQTQFRFSSELLGGALVRLMDNEVDLAILPWLLPYEELSQSVESHSLAGVLLSPICTPDFPLLQLKRPLEPKDLEGAVQIVNRSNERYLAGGYGIFPQCQHWYVNDNATKQMLIQGGVGFGALPYHMIRSELEEGELVPFENVIGFRQIKQEIRVVRRKDLPSGPVLECLWQAFRSLAFREL